MKTLYSVYRDAIKRLTEAECDSPEFDAQQLVQYCFGYNKTGLLMHSGVTVDEVKLLHFEDCIKRRCDREPLQYIIGFWDFYKYSFKVGEGVLIPRPETEILVEYAIDKINKKGLKVVFDLCCGSGCIGISIAKACPQVQVYCVDVSDIAPKQYADALTMSGTMVEGIENRGEDLVNVVTGKILDIQKHENADSLQVCQLDVGDETLQIVTGATNVKVGQIVPVAKNNSKIAGGSTIKKGKLRAVD